MFDQLRINELPVQEAGPVSGPAVLEGIRVIDFTHFVAGPLATMTLADFGADVIKVEAPNKGDDFRYYPPSDPDLPAQGAPYLWTNRSKRSLALNMRHLSRPVIAMMVPSLMPLRHCSPPTMARTRGPCAIGSP